MSRPDDLKIKGRASAGFAHEPDDFKIKGRAGAGLNPAPPSQEAPPNEGWSQYRSYLRNTGPDMVFGSNGDIREPGDPTPSSPRSPLHIRRPRARGRHRRPDMYPPPGDFYTPSYEPRGFPDGDRRRRQERSLTRDSEHFEYKHNRSPRSESRDYRYKDRGRRRERSPAAEYESTYRRSPSRYDRSPSRSQSRTPVRRGRPQYTQDRSRSPIRHEEGRGSPRRRGRSRSSRCQRDHYRAVPRNRSREPERRNTTREGLQRRNRSPLPPQEEEYRGHRGSKRRAPEAGSSHPSPKRRRRDQA
ncbi:hypothetical protein BU26DRAFT_506985 [Trematosphaeria pertusa]|uniref:Uncharacterized protein n=1 Tax=Trematosphaeria pertusa TaxID=390896 RepID=A0A6A6I768_9PLEO|nr:uncharacterized protein BU26DRAFT_506985 [Trematosphaeria pertusa]KAF2246375.1 hypothetical protein BU26DRAFT_506985 [Trematosphaeria pertusa]